MSGWITRGMVVCAVAMATTVSAQDKPAGPGRLEVSIIPGGASFVTSKDELSNFTNYDAGGALAYNFTRVLGVEGELAGSFGLRQKVAPFQGSGPDFIEEKTPNLLSYTANVVAMLPGHSFVPYATAGIGGTTLYQREELRIFNTDTFLTTNVGGGVKWYAPSGRWGVRGDYRFQVLSSRDNAPDFIGSTSRFAHRIYGAFVINAVK